jgi:hypothetical protein
VRTPSPGGGAAQGGRRSGGASSGHGAAARVRGVGGGRLYRRGVPGAHAKGGGGAGLAMVGRPNC